ncbi:RNA-dependent RNA polymerase family protein [Flavisolibacter ginsengisoli]|jgi:hypothetical protein|uniref:Reverse transcriptase (RNA-dependent DNA polymerase) n=1 Tax=Flavisolibacter ginsengisoli DSM 18119 TaxID=1121884 RepID=A0A1M5FRS6_9BACT|nr:hypothetical protein [Flavisolibacter ginsengisoli]SHF94257.1 hypothetical protein SAMN02745131_03925 [Flavisolibacter ginsengisoli DSM 18119]
MSFELHQIREAYIKLKSYIYFDSTDLLLRRKLVEFETNTIKDDILSLIKGGPRPYLNKISFKKLKISESVDKKLESIKDALNEYHEDQSFFDYFLAQITVLFYPKSIEQRNIDENFITNKRIESSYKVDRVNAFIDAPLELHILSVLWIMEYGVHYDAVLDDSCLGNRLLLNKSKDKVVQGSSLFKPYFKQYQKWRDDSVKAAQSLLKDNRNALFLNLDIQDYFHSVRIPTTKLYNNNKAGVLQHLSNLEEIFLKIHTIYSEKVGKKYEVPYEFFKSLKKDNSNNLSEIILPIGLLSSYVLANDFLKDFDTRIFQLIKPAYYGRYVDDILIVIADPKPDYHKTEKDEDFKFSFKKYKNKINRAKKRNEKVSFSEESLTQLEEYVLQNFSVVIKLIDTPPFIQKETNKDKHVQKSFKLCGYDSLYCQSAKSLLYFFDSEESDLVIDKLKKELDEKTSEFRDFPEEDHNEESFEESAYYLQYDGSDGKIRTLKDYKENRYGLTVYLANKIFSALRHERQISDEEGKQVLKFFRGSNCINFYRLWEKIFTYFLVNRQAKTYVDFYLHCLIEIQKLVNVNKKNKVQDSLIKETMTNYLDCAHELALSLNPKFIKDTQEAFIHFEFQLRKIESTLPFFFSLSFEPTKSNSFWVYRFRQTNMIRHHYVIHPLLNYTRKSKKGMIDLTSLNFSFQDYYLDQELLNNSPRAVKFWECCLAIALEKLSKFEKRSGIYEDGRIITNVLGITDVVSKDTFKEDEHTDEFYLDAAFELYKQINQNHIPSYKFDEEDFREQFYKRSSQSVHYDKIKPLKVQEIRVSSGKSKLAEPSISFANTEVKEDNILKSLRGIPNLGLERYQQLSEILKSARVARSNILIFPEFFIPINLLSSLVRYSEKNSVLTITGLEHVTVDFTVFNFIVTILPVEVGGIRDAVVVFRLKNHYAHAEEALIEGNHFAIPKPSPYRYDIFNWRNIYFSSYYCFELANSLHRSLMKGKIDLLIGVEWNRDTPYFSNIVETGSRDLHTYVAQVNTSQYGDTRLTQPVETARKDILRLKGGTNDTILVAKININRLREFQRQKFSLTHSVGEFKPLPPDFLLQDVLRRMRNESIL